MTINRDQVANLVKNLPDEKLPIAFAYIKELLKSTFDELSLQEKLMLLSPVERGAVLTEQAAQATAEFEKDKKERLEWQSGDFLDEY